MDIFPLSSIDSLANIIRDGDIIAVPPDYSFVSMAGTRALIRNNKKNLHLVAVPQSGIQTDILIGSGCVEIVEAAAISLGEYGGAPRFLSALLEKEIVMKDSTCPAIHASLQASEKGLPFIPLRGIIGSDLLKAREDWVLGINPFKENDPVVMLPPLSPDIALFHAPFADKNGNIWIGRRRELMTMAHASKQTLVTVEEVREIDLMEDIALAGSSIPALYITGISIAPKGAWPLGITNEYQADNTNLATYAKMAQSEAGFLEYMSKYK